MRQRDVQRKIDFLMDNFDKIEVLKQYSYHEFSSRFELVDSVIHRLQTSIEALLDIARVIIASLGLRAAGTNAEVIEVLKDAEFLSDRDVQRYVRMIGFRNRIVHEYNTIDLEKLYGILQKDSGDLKKLCACLLKVIERFEKGTESCRRARFLE